MGIKKPAPGEGKSSLAKVSSLMGKSLTVENPGLDTETLVTHRSMQTVHIDQVKRWHDNPRTKPNPKRQEVKDSIQADGLDCYFKVCKLPGEDVYTLISGQGTRLDVAKELFLEGHLVPDVQIKQYPYVSDIELLRGHINENATQGIMSFWDYAKSYAKLKFQIEQELGFDLSQRKFLEQLAERKIVISTSSVSYYLFAYKYLSAIGHFADELTLEYVKKTQPRILELSRAWLKWTQDSDDSAYVDWHDQACSNFLEQYQNLQTSEFFGSLVEMLQAKFCQEAKVSLETFNVLLKYSEEMKDAGWEELLNAVEFKIQRSQQIQPQPTQKPDPTPTQPGKPPVVISEPTTQVTSQINDQTPLADIQQHVVHLSQSIGIEALVRIDDLAFGFWVEPWSLDQNPPSLEWPKFNLWWWLSNLSCQWSDMVWQQLPDESDWKQLMALGQSDAQSAQYLEDLAAFEPRFASSWAENLVFQTLTVIEHPDALDTFKSLFELMQRLQQYTLNHSQNITSFTTQEAGAAGPSS